MLLVSESVGEVINDDGPGLADDWLRAGRERNASAERKDAMAGSGAAPVVVLKKRPGA
jgi:hypothetical protein